MAKNAIHLVSMGESSDDSEEKYEIYEAGSNMLCVIGLDNSQPSVKAPRLKPKYKQSYREAWESMRDFKGWLTSVPGNNTKAYCKLCKKELHCHRLSLLKHKVTFKHHKKEEEQKLIKLYEGKNETNSKKSLKARNEDEDNEPNEVDDDNNDGKSDNVPNQQTGSKVEGDNVKITISSSPSGKIIASGISNEITHEKEEASLLKNGSLSTHVLNISKGVPAASVHVVLYKLIDGRWTLLNEGVTDSDGRYINFVTNSDELSPGRYKLHFDVDKYFEKQNQETIFPFIEIVFDIKDSSTNYHIPLLLSPFGYSIYKGS